MKIIEIHCCFECPYCTTDMPSDDAFCKVAKRNVKEKGELCPPSWCPLPDDSE